MRKDGVNSIEFEEKRALELAEQSSTMDEVSQTAYIEHELLNEQADRINEAWEERTGR